MNESNHVKGSCQPVQYSISWIRCFRFMLRHLEFGGKIFGSSKNEHLYLSGSGHYRSDFRNCVKRKGYLDVGIRHSVDIGRTIYFREKSKGYCRGAMIMDEHNTKCVVL